MTGLDREWWFCHHVNTFYIYLHQETALANCLLFSSVDFLATMASALELAFTDDFKLTHNLNLLLDFVIYYLALKDR